MQSWMAYKLFLQNIADTNNIKIIVKEGNMAKNIIKHQNQILLLDIIHMNDYYTFVIYFYWYEN